MQVAKVGSALAGIFVVFDGDVGFQLVRREVEIHGDVIELRVLNLQVCQCQRPFRSLLLHAALYVCNEGDVVDGERLVVGKQ